MQPRFWELDAVRGAAVLMMILFHLLFDLSFFGAAEISVSSGGWLVFGRLTALIMLLVAGISLHISSSRGRSLSHYAKRGAKIFLYGMLITAATLIFLPRGAIFFGVLHMIGVSIIIGYFFTKHPRAALAAGALIIAIGLYISQLTFGFAELLWLGMAPAGLYMFDYFPLLPWLGLPLIGIWIGSRLYPEGKGKLPAADNERGNAIRRGIAWTGRHSLIIYFIHQPAIILILWLLGVADAGLFF